MFSFYQSPSRTTTTHPNSPQASSRMSQGRGYQRQQQRSPYYLATSPVATVASTFTPPPTAPTATVTTPVLPKSIIFATSGLGGCLGWAVIHPFNTIAVRSNLASASGQTFSIKEMLQKQGFMSLYDGLSAGIARQVFYATARFGLFETFRDILHDYRGKTDFAAR